MCLLIIAFQDLLQMHGKNTGLPLDVPVWKKEERKQKRIH